MLSLHHSLLGAKTIPKNHPLDNHLNVSIASTVCGYKAFRSFLATTNQPETHDLNMFETHVILRMMMMHQSYPLIRMTDHFSHQILSRRYLMTLQSTREHQTQVPRQQMPLYNSHQSCKFSLMMLS